MHCLYCGKDIGALRLLKDREFCSAAHRKSYKDRLGKVLTQIAGNDTPPPPRAGFLTRLPPQKGNISSTMALWQASGLTYRLCLPAAWPDAIQDFNFDAAEAESTQVADPTPPPYVAWIIRSLPEAVESWLSLSVASPCTATVAVMRPSMPKLCVDKLAHQPAVCDAYALTPLAEPVAAWLSISIAEQIPAARAVALPDAPTLLLDAALEQPAVCDAYALSPTSEPVATWLSISAAEQLPTALAIALPNAAALLLDAALEQPAAYHAYVQMPADPPVATWPSISAAEQLPSALAIALPDAPALLLDAAFEQPAVCDTYALSPTSEPVATWLSISAAEQIPAAFAVALPAPPPLLLDAALEQPAVCEAYALTPSAEPVAAWLPASAVDQLLTALAVALPNTPLLLDAAFEQPAAYHTYPQMPADQPAAALLLTSAQPIAQILPVALPTPQPLGISEAFRPPISCDHPFGLPTAEPAARWLQPSLAHAVASPIPVAVPTFAIGAGLFASAFTPVPCDSWASAPVPEPAEVLHRAFSTYSESQPAASVVPPGLIAVNRLSPAICPYRPSAPAEPVAALLPMSSAVVWQHLAERVFTPRFEIIAELEPLPLHDALDVPAPCERWRSTPPAEPVWDFLTSATASAIRVPVAPASPELALSASGPHVPMSFASRPVPRPEAVMAGVWPRIAATPLDRIGDSHALCLPEMFRKIAARAATAPAHRIARHVPVTELPSYVSSAGPITSAAEPRMQPFALGKDNGRSAPMLDRARLASRAAEPVAARGSLAVLEPIATLQVTTPAHWSACAAAAIPRPSYIAIEYHMQQTRNAAFSHPKWKTVRFEPFPPQFAIHAALEKLEDLVKPQNTSTAPIFRMQEARRARSAMMLQAGRIAAAVLVVAAVWFSAAAVKSRGHLNLRPDEASYAISNRVLTADSHTGNADPPASTGPLSWVRRSLGERATVQVGEDFQHGMESWGATGGSYPKGWQHHPDGFVRVGALALFRPTKTFTDYRLEFFGQIENKSMGWAVRARDPQNYHAMKFTVVAGGLRPIIALVHYNVIDGKAARPVQTPLSVMVHNNQPLQVAVNVRGNRMVTSVDGEEVDTYINDVLPSGGVGFFSDAGEQSRLYWAKVTKNDDWLGHICGFLSGDDARATAEVRAPADGGGSAPNLPVEEPSALAAAGMGLPYFRRNYTRRHKRCNS